MVYLSQLTIKSSVILRCLQTFSAALFLKRITGIEAGFSVGHVPMKLCGRTKTKLSGVGGNFLSAFTVVWGSVNV